MKKNRLHLVVAAAFGVALAAAVHGASFDLNRIFGVGKDLATAAGGISEKEEIAVGRELAGRTLGAAPLVDDPALQAYVNRVGRWVASQSERADLPWHFGVIETASVNAFAAPGGYVLITRGLYEILENESQLAGVLGHEIGHIVKRHHIEVMQKQAGVSAAAGAGQELLAQRSRSAASPLINNLIGTGAEIFARGLDKDAEYEADHIGVVLAARSGYSPYGLVEVLHKLQARGSSDASLALLFATHPLPGDRLGKLGDALTPRLADLPEGLQPAIQPVAATAPRARAGTPPPARAGARAMQQERSQSLAPPAPAGARQSGGGGGIDPGSLLRGLIGR